ncbi:MAG TPA: hypothetical protein VGD02_06825 [Gemmatimonadaceae bacterium]|jgi:hypothetical protein
MSNVNKARAILFAAIIAAPLANIDAQASGQQLAEDFRVVTTMAGANDTAYITGHAVGDATRLRIEVNTTGVGSQVSPLNANGPVSMIVSDSGKTITYLDSQRSTYLRVRPADMIQNMQQMGGMTMQFSETTANVDSLGAGPTLLGHPTSRYRVNTGMTMNMSAMGQSQSMKFSSSTEYLFARDVNGALNPFASLSGGDMVNMFGSANKDFADKMRAVQAKLPKGTPLRATSTATMSAQGDTRTTSTVAEVTSLKWVPADKNAFEIPATYKETQLPSMGAMGGGAPPPR